MAIQTKINSGGCDPLRTAFTKTNENFTELYTRITTAEGQLGISNKGGATIEQSIIGSVIGADSTVILDHTTGTITGKVVGDVTGSVVADDSTVLIDGVAGTINAGALTGDLPAIDGSALTGISVSSIAFSNITSKPTTLAGYGITDAATSAQGTKADSAVQPATLGNFTFTSSVLDSSDSSGITITPAVTMSSDLTVENNLNVTNVITANRFTSTSTDDPEIKANANLKVTAGNAVVITSSPVRFCSFTTTERDALASANGDMVYNSTTNKFQGYANGAWVDLH